MRLTVRELEMLVVKAGWLSASDQFVAGIGSAGLKESAVLVKEKEKRSDFL